MKPEGFDRRGFLRWGLRGAFALVLGGVAGAVSRRTRNPATVWQIDPSLCVQCGGCATSCVLSPSAVKCVHEFDQCGYCKLCFGYFEPDAGALTSSAENQVCPTGALVRCFVEPPYYEYTVDEPICIGCGRCVLGCRTFGNGALTLQVRHDLCLHCNDCSVARSCPAGAFKRVPPPRPASEAGGKTLP
jgi:electron transport complex protein RnfB